MSALSEDHLNPHHPMYYAPRWLRERSGSRLAPAPEATSEPAGRSGSTSGTFDTQLENAVSEALRHPLDPEVVRDPPALTRELDRRWALIGVAGRFAAAIGVSAVVALFFVIMAPAAWQPEGSNSSLSAIIQSMRAALPQPAPTTESAPKSALADFQAILATPKASEPATPEPSTATSEPSTVTPDTSPVTREQSEQLLQEFVQWRQKPAPAQTGEK
jgi:hypothetical protein